MDAQAMTAQTPTQRKAAERKRKREAGLEEVRGIYAPKTEHARIKAMAKQLTLPVIV
jgi:hypothetical protein